MDTNNTLCSCQNAVYSDNRMTIFDEFTMVSVSVGMVFLTLTVLSFALCRQHLNMTNMARINAYISLLLIHIIFLLRMTLLPYMKANNLGLFVAGVLHYLFLCAFLWMFIEALLLFISAKNLMKIPSDQKEVLGWKSTSLIGYVVPLIVVVVSVKKVPDKYNTEMCWVVKDWNTSWIIIAPVYFIFALIVILFIAMFFIIIFTLKKLNSNILQRTQTPADKKLIISLLFKIVAQFVVLAWPWLVAFYIYKSSSTIFPSDTLENLYNVSVALQGFLIFIVHCVLNQEVQHQCRKWTTAFRTCKKCPKTVQDIQVEGGGASGGTATN
ncbi:adhesion G protein-coupled receptor E3-like [Hoplias malabaricus]|uniref:adhesion G protein-coupled receptor E3-like n=1 Tax=Hoplias malabaricus TaxID=27720 RepID=UPI003462B3BE